jgi:glycyl-tRNA synthetase (class II)
MSWKNIIKEDEDDDFPRYVPRDGAYITVEEQEERGRYLFDKKNLGRVYRNKVNGKNYIFNRLYNNGEIELISQPDEKEYPTMREKLQQSIDKLKEAQGKEGENPNLDAAIKNTQLLLENEDDEVLDYRQVEKERVHRITPVFASTYELLPEQ